MAEHPITERSGIRVLIADDHPGFRDELRRLVSSQPAFTLIGEIETAHDTLGAVATAKSDVLLLDAGLLPREGRLLQALVNPTNGTRTILLAFAHDHAVLLDALLCGARGVVFRDAAPRVLCTSIFSVAAGLYWVYECATPARQDALKLLIDLQRARPAAVAARPRIG